MGYLDHQRLLVLDETRRMLWIGKPEELLDGIPIDQMPETRRPRSVRLSRQRHFRTPQGDLTHVSSPNGRDTYLWHMEGESRGKRLAVSRPQDFTFDYQNGDKLLVLPKERVLYCAGRMLNGCITAITTVGDADPASAEVYTGRALTNLRRKKAYQPMVIGSRLELRLGSHTLACSRSAMHLADEPLRMLDPTSLKLELDNQKGLAHLTRA